MKMDILVATLSTLAGAATGSNPHLIYPRNDTWSVPQIKERDYIMVFVGETANHFHVRKIRLPALDNFTL